MHADQSQITVDKKVAVIGLGYVGLPLALAFGKLYPTLGFDIDAGRIHALRAGQDVTREASTADIEAAGLLSFTTEPADLQASTIFIVTVPTPVDRHKQPDLSPLMAASTLLGGLIKPGDVVIYESTVYPGATEERCIPVIEQVSGLKYNRDFFAGYSPERINPADKSRPLTKIIKVTSGSTPEAAQFVDELYASIIEAGTHLAPSIRVAEAAKVIENTQRDLNIALINELAIIFNKLGIDTEAVLTAAGTKWNFLPFRPGLVGGHCIGVDPYYLTHKAQALGYHPEVILAGRRINDGMGHYVAAQLVKGLLKQRIQVDNARVLIMGFAFKENCPDIRNTRVIDIVRELGDYGMRVDVYDPETSAGAIEQEYGFAPIEQLASGAYDAMVLAVAHDVFRQIPIAELRQLGKPVHVLYDLKYLFPAALTDLRL